MTLRVVTFGEGLGLAHTTETGSLAHLSSLRVTTGGAEGNVAIGLARLGVPVTWFGHLGADGLGERVARELRAEGVDTRVVTEPDAPTGLMLKERPQAGRTRVLYYRTASAGSRLTAADLPALDLESASLLHVTGITPALSDSAAALVRAALDRAAELGVEVAFDVNHRATLWPGRDAAAAYREVAARATLVFAGEDEARLLCPDAGDDPERLARALAALGPREAVVKRGPAGAVAVVDGVTGARPAVPVDVVDTVGAGDAFVAAYLAERLRGGSPAARLTAATVAGALACTGPGDWESLPRRADLVRAERPSEPVER